MKPSRLSGRKVCERVKTKGLLWKGKHFHVRFLHGSPRTVAVSSTPRIFIGIVTSAKLDPSAVRRNRMRRRCREAIRTTLLSHTASGSAQLIVLPRSSSLRTPFNELLTDASRLLQFLSSPPK